MTPTKRSPAFSGFLERYHQEAGSATDHAKPTPSVSPKSLSVVPKNSFAVPEPAPAKEPPSPASPTPSRPIWPKWPAHRDWEALHYDGAFHAWIAQHYVEPTRTRYLTLLKHPTLSREPGTASLYYALRHADAFYRWATHPEAKPWHQALDDALLAPIYRTLWQHWNRHQYVQDTARQISRCWTDTILRDQPDPHPDFETLGSAREQETPDTSNPAQCDPQPLSDIPDHPDLPSDAEHAANDSETPQNTLTSAVPPSTDAQPTEDTHRASQSDGLPLAQWIQTWDHLEAYHDTAAWLDRLSTLIQQLDPTCQPLSVLQAWIPEAFPENDTLHALLQLIDLAYPASASR